MSLRARPTERMALPADYMLLSPSQKRRARHQYIADQGGNCMYCECALHQPPPKWVTNKVIKWRFFPKNFLKYPIHLQHNHYTNMTEGAVHAYCNAVLWQYEGR